MELKHQLPAQAPLKDFIHHNTLHAFMNLPFKDGIRKASRRFGYRVLLPLKEFREAYRSGRINHHILLQVIQQEMPDDSIDVWLQAALEKDFAMPDVPGIGTLRGLWKRRYKIDLDSLVHPILFRLLCNFLDQGIAIRRFPNHGMSFIDAVRELEKDSLVSLFRTKRASALLLDCSLTINELLAMLISDESKYAQYLFDQQFAHQGWSGMVSAIEQQPGALLDGREITLEQLIKLELILEIDALHYLLSDEWQPLTSVELDQVPDLFAEPPVSELEEVLYLWQLAYEWSYYDTVLSGIATPNAESTPKTDYSFQAVFCIDDRECSLRRYLELAEPDCATYGTPGFFGVEFYYKPVNGQFVTKLCPAPVNPRHLIKEVSTDVNHDRDFHLVPHAHSMYGGWLMSQTLGFWSALKLAINVFYPTFQPGSTSSFRHMSSQAKLQIKRSEADDENNLFCGFTTAEMTVRVENTLRSMGLVANYAPLVYIVGHGASSTNNPHYAAYDCGACSGRAGSVNARVFSAMANNKDVRHSLKKNGIDIPDETRFVGALHDTTCDEVEFFDEAQLSNLHASIHRRSKAAFAVALQKNAIERSRRFFNLDSRSPPQKIHQHIKRRAITLFEPRPELNHATNALCVIGRRDLTSHLFLDRRAFMNSFDCRVDAEGNYLFPILKAVAPVCGGINLEYFFSALDNQKLWSRHKAAP